VGDQGFVYLFVYKIKLVRATDAPAGAFQCLLQYLDLRFLFSKLLCHRHAGNCGVVSTSYLDTQISP
jgi:hypothetical protein